MVIKMLFPNCSEYIEHLGIKEEEIPYIKKRIRELRQTAEDRKSLLDYFVEDLNKPDSDSNFTSSGDVEHYDKIKGELLAKRKEVCPFCKEALRFDENHIKKFHNQELKIVLNTLSLEDFNKIKKQICMDGLKGEK